VIFIKTRNLNIKTTDDNFALVFDKNHAIPIKFIQSTKCEISLK
jgi:hypothetical protein